MPGVDFETDFNPPQQPYGRPGRASGESPMGLTGRMVSWGLAKDRKSAGTLLAVAAIILFCIMLYLAYGFVDRHQGTGRPIPPAITYAD